MASVSLKGVSKIYPGRNGGDVTAVGELNLEIQDREFVVLVGPSGCGLSSIVRMIAGLDPISKGDILIGDRRVNDEPAGDRDTALVSRNFTPYPRMSVQENLAFGLKRRKFSGTEIAKRVRAAVGVLGLETLLEAAAESLSAEQRQRVAMARALALQPKVFLFDEPLADLEPKTCGELRREIVKLQQRLQATMVYATHDPIEGMALGGRIVVVNDGAIQQDGTAQTLYQEPSNVFVAGFMGSPPMNFVRGTLKHDREWLLFSEAEGGTIEVRLPVSEFPGSQDLGGKPVVLGIRPEDIKVADVTNNTGKHPDSFPAIIDHVEPMGRETSLSVQTGAHTLVCRTGRQMDNQEAGHRSQFQLNLARVCLFDAVSSRRIT